MKIEPYVKKLESSPEFKEFSSKHQGAYVAAGFFVLDLESDRGVHQIDYYIPSEKKVAAFTLDDQVTVQLLDLINSKVPEPVSLKTNIDLEALKGILEDEMKNRSITDEVKKIIAILQNIDGKRIWNLNCVLSGMGILRAHIDDETKTVLRMEKSSIMDLVKKVDPKDLEKMKAQAGPSNKPTKEEVKEEIEKLDKLEEAIEKEKEELEKEIKEY